MDPPSVLLQAMLGAKSCIRVRAKRQIQWGPTDVMYKMSQESPLPHKHLVHPGHLLPFGIWFCPVMLSDTHTLHKKPHLVYLTQASFLGWFVFLFHSFSMDEDFLEATMFAV